MAFYEGLTCFDRGEVRAHISSEKEVFVDVFRINMYLYDFTLFKDLEGGSDIEVLSEDGGAVFSARWSYSRGEQPGSLGSGGDSIFLAHRRDI